MRARITIELTGGYARDIALDVLLGQFTRATKGESAVIGETVELTLSMDGTVYRENGIGGQMIYEPRKPSEAKQSA